MNPERHERVMGLFKAAVEIDAADRAAFLRKACADEAALFDEVASLLRWDDPTVAGSPESPESPTVGGAPGDAPERIGPYEIDGLLGAGGMAVVYRARQGSPTRSVALKVLRASCTDATALLRFRREIALLSRLRHPGIAQICDAGVARERDADVPYFAMELIEGRPLTAFANERALDRAERLRLLLCVCDAVEYAHQRGIIHRDLKPANILVEDGGGAGRPRVLDFGIARQLGPSDADGAFVTRDHHVLGTLAYMSPDQLDPDCVIDTRSDVYALAAIGFELLSGRPPLGVAGLSQLSAIRAIQTRTPPALGAVNPACRGDLSLIFEKALAKDPAERYGSVAAFADDLRAFLEHRPVRARPPGLLYAARKFTQRNPVAVALAALTMIAVIGGALGTGLGLHRARRANEELRRRSAETTESARFLVRDVVAGLDSVAGTAEIRRALLERLRAQIVALRRHAPDDADLIDDHAVVLTYYSDALLRAGRDAEALALRREALGLYRGLAARRTASPADEARVSIALVKVGDVHLGWAEWDLARDLYGQAFDIDRRLAAAHPDSVWFLDNLAWSHDRLGNLAMVLDDLDAAEPHFAERLAITTRLLERAPERHATRHGVVAINVLMAQLAKRRGDLPAVESYLRAAHGAAIKLASDTPNHRLYVETACTTSRDLADLLVEAGQPREALVYMEDAVRRAARLRELDPRDTRPLDIYFGVLVARTRLALVLGDVDAAERFLAEARDLAAGDAARALGEHSLESYARLVTGLASALEAARSGPTP